MANRMDWWEVLDVLAWGFSKLACPTLRGILDGYQEQPAPRPAPASGDDWSPDSGSSARGRGRTW